MSQQRRRHHDRQPVEETVRLAISDLVANGGTVETERHKYDWRTDDLLVWIRLKAPIAETVLETLRQRLAQRMNELLPIGQPLDEWMVVVECNGEPVFRLAWNERLEATGAEKREA
jgi:hypothetical protein